MKIFIAAFCIAGACFHYWQGMFGAYSVLLIGLAALCVWAHWKDCEET